MGLKYLEVFLLSEEDQKTSGTNQISLKGCGKNMFNSAKHWRAQKGKEQREESCFSISFYVFQGNCYTYYISPSQTPSSLSLTLENIRPGNGYSLLDNATPKAVSAGSL